MANVMTYAQALEIALTAIGDGNAEATERIKALMGQLAKRGSKGGMTKTQKLNEEIKAVLLDILEGANGFISMAEIRSEDGVAEYSVQKIGALLGQLVKAGKIQKQVYKKITFYALAGIEFAVPEGYAENDAE